MKILTINTEFFRGGAALVARTLHNALNESSRFSSYFAYGRGPKVNKEKVFKFVWQLEVYFHAFLTRITGLQGYGSWFSTKRFQKFILKENFDLIHLHNFHGYYLDLSFIKFLGKLNIPIIWTLHDGWPITGRCAYFFECNHWKIGCGNCSNLSWYPKTYFDSSAFMWKRKKEYFTSEWNPIIVCPSQWLAEQIKKSYLNKYQTKVIPNGVNTEIFRPKDKINNKKELGISSGKKIILTIAADLKDERKGIKYFFNSLKKLDTKNYLVLTVGKKIDKLTNFPFEIRQFGYISNQNFLADIYNIADIFCITSLDENFPITVLESMACGTPVVGFKTGGIIEQVTDNCGILVEPKNTEQLAEAMEKILKDEERRKKFGLNCRKRVLENYSIEKFKEQYLNLYKNVLE
ncbi:glycosyltransferase family 4 protein [Thermodesulfovibrionales bacterium]|nr:glycosyltransferase family 4 protein [Thermodesulfovibrionales bacterium]